MWVVPRSPLTALAANNSSKHHHRNSSSNNNNNILLETKPRVFLPLATSNHQHQTLPHPLHLRAIPHTTPRTARISQDSLFQEFNNYPSNNVSRAHMELKN